MKSFQVKTELPVSASEVYSDWLNSEKHSSFTGGEAQISAKLGAEFSAWDDYIEGRILELDEGKRIYMEWSTTEFPEHSEPSFVEVLFKDLDSGGCELILNHSNIPEGQDSNYKTGWVDHYFEPMRKFYRNKN